MSGAQIATESSSLQSGTTLPLGRGRRRREAPRAAAPVRSAPGDDATKDTRHIPRTARGLPELWRYTTGAKGYNRVSVYERVPGGPLQILWYDSSGPHRESLKTAAGDPVYDKKLATLIADRASKEQGRARERRTAGVLLGIGERRTLGDLLEQLHKDKEAGWSAPYLKDQRRMRGFWEVSLGKAAPLPLPPARVEQIAKTAARAKGWSARSHQAYLRYLVDAVYYAQHKLKWLTESENLSAVSFPKVQSTSKPYSATELQAMLAKAESVDLRIAGILHVAYDTQRRAAAIRTLRVDAYRVEEIDGRERAVLAFPGHTDKARRSGEAVLTSSTRRILDRLLQQPEVRKSGHLFPGLKRDGRRTLAPITDKTLRALLRRVEQAAGVEHVEGRGLHGVKRRAVTEAIRASGVRVASKQSGTTEQTLSYHYDQDDIEDKAALADALEQKKGKA